MKEFSTVLNTPEGVPPRVTPCGTAFKPKVGADEVRRGRGIDKPVREDYVLQNLSQLCEVLCAYGQTGLKAAQFITYGVTQRTISQFVEVGWKGLEA
jgi:hypothetical protein